ncbi:flavodoxin family protein [Limnobacter sp.]|uniref:flavodoxin family protein n=1 Tax=Limnobacter sp. TaxID=2003368 RepID=UPI0035125D5D
MKTLLIAYHSRTGATHAMAQAVGNGASAETNVKVLVQPATETTSEHVLQADAYVFAAPEMLGSMSGLMKDLFDRTYYDVLDQINGRPFATVVCAGSDGQGAVRQIQRIATGWRLNAIAPALVVCTHAQTAQAILAKKQLGASDLQRGFDLGEGFAAGLAQGIF